MFGTGVGCFVLEEALQHAGRKADRWGVIHAIQSFGAHINNACPGEVPFLPASPSPTSQKKTFLEQSDFGLAFGGEKIEHSV